MEKVESRILTAADSLVGTGEEIAAKVDSIIHLYNDKEQMPKSHFDGFCELKKMALSFSNTYKGRSDISSISSMIDEMASISEAIISFMKERISKSNIFNYHLRDLASIAPHGIDTVHSKVTSSTKPQTRESLSTALQSEIGQGNVADVISKQTTALKSIIEKFVQSK